LRGFIKGGTGSFVADMLMSQAERGNSGQGFAEFVAGPAVDVLDKLLFNVAFGSIVDVFEGSLDADEAAFRVLGKTLDTFVPNMPFVKMAIQREVLSNIHKMGDQKWQSKQRKYARERRKETGNKHWYKP